MVSAHLIQGVKRALHAVGADADITIFDPATVIDRATFEQPALYSEGIRHVLVGGTFVVRDEKIVKNVKPGKAIRRSQR